MLGHSEETVPSSQPTHMLQGQENKFSDLVNDFPCLHSLPRSFPPFLEELTEADRQGLYSP